MAKVNNDGTIDGEMKVVDEDVNKKSEETEELKKDNSNEVKKPSMVKKALKITGGVLGTAAVIGLSVFAGTKIKR